MISCYGCRRTNDDDALVCAGCQALLQVNGYRLLYVLGQGGCGAVYQARMLPEAARRRSGRPGQLVALKQNLDPAGLHQLEREFAVLRGLRHPNLPRYHEFFQRGSQGYLVMEFVPGQSLDAVLQRSRDGLSESQVLGYALQLCDVLSYLHEQVPPILHRDIKPANIRLTPDGLIKLVDFGLLKQGTGQTRLSIQGLGTVEYAPLEQYGRGGSTDPRSDIYSLGATLYHLLTGQPPDDAITRITSTPDPVRSPRGIRPALSAHVAEAIIRALAMRPEDRFAGIEQFRVALVATGRAAPVAAERSVTGGTTLPPVEPPVIVVANPPPLPVLFPVAGEGTDPNLILSLPAPVDSVAFAPDGRVFAAGGADGIIRLWNPRTGQLLHTLTGGAGPVYSLAFTPDSQMLAAGAWGPQGTIWMWRVADGTLVRKLLGFPGPVKGLAFAPDGQTLASADADGTVRLWQTADGACTGALVAHEAESFHSVLCLAYAPDGQVLVVGSAVVQFWEPGSRQMLDTLPETQGYVHSVAFTADGQTLATAGGDRLIRLWRVADRQLLATLAGHTSFVTTVAFAPDGLTLASASYDGTICLWQVSDWSPLRSLDGHQDAVTGMAFAPDGSFLASGSWDKTVRIWGMV